MIKKLHLVFISFWCFTACNQQNSTVEQSSLDDRDQIKLEQYIVAGEILYQLHCSNCHKTNGEGLARLIPPLSNADYFSQDSSKLLCVMKYGLEGSIKVNGVEYNQPMPANLKLTNLELAELSAFLYNKFQGKEKLILPESVGKTLNGCQIK